MEYIFDYDIVGEILIPLENNLIQSDPNFAKQPSLSNPHFKLDSVFEKDFKDFRSILFQGELLRLFVVVKIDKSRDLNISELMNNLYIKSEFDSSCDLNEFEMKKTEETSSMNPLSHQSSKNIQEDIDTSQMMTDVDLSISDLFSIHRSSIFNNKTIDNANPSNNAHYNYTNLNHDYISRRLLIEEKNIAVFEVIKHIIVPNKFLNKILILKLNVMRKNGMEFIRQYSMLDIFTTGLFNDYKEFTILKTLFKEVKIIRPLVVSKAKQIDILPDTSLLQVKIENITSSINFIDKSLKLSKFLKTKSEDVDVLNYGICLIIREIQVLKEETVVDKKMTINIKSLEQYIKNDKIPLSNVHFSVLNSDFPIEVKPGEELILTLKVFKSAFIYEKIKTPISGTNEISTSANNTTILTPILAVESPQKLVRSETTVGKILNTTSNFNIAPRQTLQNVPISIPTEANIRPSSTLVNAFTSNKPQPDEGLLCIDNDEIIKVTLSTPIILNISSYKFYDSLFMHIPIKWHNEINRFLKIEIDIEESIKLHEYFIVLLKCKNISNTNMNLLLEISDSSEELRDCNRYLDTEVFDYKGKSTDQIPSVLSETKIKNIGVFNTNEEKVIDLKFLPLKNGFNPLPSFSITDKITNRKFFIVHTNKIYVQED